MPIIEVFPSPSIFFITFTRAAVWKLPATMKVLSRNPTQVPGSANRDFLPIESSKEIHLNNQR